MASPSVVNTATDFATSGGTTAVNLPASIVSGRLLVIGSIAVGGVSAIDGFIQIGSPLALADSYQVQLWAKVATGSEGATVTATTPGASLSCFVAYQVQDWGGGLASLIRSAGATGTSANPNPDQATGPESRDYLAIAFAGHEDENGFSGFPSGYGDTTTVHDSINTSMGGAALAFTGTSADPGTFTAAGSADPWGAFTLLISPVGTPEPPRTIVRYTCNDNGSIAWSTVAPESGDLVLVCFANDGGDNQSTPSSPEPLVRLDSGDGAVDVSGGAYYRVCDGTETGDIVSTTVAAAASGFNVNTEEYGCHVIHIPSELWSGDTADIQISSKQEVSTGTIDPPEVTPSWDGTAAPWTAIVFATRDDDDGITSLGANYTTNFLRTPSGTAGPEIATSWRELTAASENPPTATQTNTNEAIVSFTIAVRGPVDAEAEFEVEPASEADRAENVTLTVEPVLTVEAAAEADSAFDVVMAVEEIFDAEPAAEVDSAFDVEMAPIVALDTEPASEIDRAADVEMAAEPVFTVEEAAETDRASDATLAAEPVFTVEPAAEVDRAEDVQVGAEPALNVEPAAETDRASDTALSVEPVFEAEPASEADRAFDVDMATTAGFTVEPAAEADRASDVVMAVEPVFVAEPAAEVDRAEDVAMEAVAQFTVEPAFETDRAFDVVMAVEPVFATEPAAETDRAFDAEMAVEQGFVVAPASEADRAFDVEMEAVVGIIVEPAAETDRAFDVVMGAEPVLVVEPAVEVDRAFDVDLTGALPPGPAYPTCEVVSPTVACNILGPDVEVSVTMIGVAVEVVGPSCAMSIIGPDVISEVE